jgi:hypothetical protein
MEMPASDAAVFLRTLSREKITGKSQGYHSESAVGILGRAGSGGCGSRRSA